MEDSGHQEKQRSAETNTCTVKEIERMIESLGVQSPDEQGLGFAEKQLESGPSVPAVNDDKNESTKQTGGRLRGGMFHVSSGKSDFEELRTLTTDIKVTTVRGEVCIHERTVRMDGTSDARQRSAALAGLHNETGADMHELGVKKGELEQAVAALKQNGDQSCAENSCLCRGVLRLCFAANFRLCTSLSKFEGTEKLVRDRFCSRLA